MRTLTCSSLCVLWALFSLSSARADEGDIELARNLFQEGTKLARGGEWEEASRRFARSASLKPHAVTKYNLAYCARVQGYLERARDLFLESIAEHMARGETELQPELLEIARAYVAELDTQIASKAAPQPRAAPQPLPNAGTSASTPAPPEPSKRDADPSRPLSAGVYASVIIGVAGLATGAITGAIVWSRESELAVACPEKRCSGEAADSLDGARTLADVSTASFIVGAAGLVTAVAFWWYSDARPGPPEPEPYGLRPWVGLAAVGCSGRF